MGFLKACYYACAIAAFASMFHVVYFVGWHSWGRVWLGVPIGQITGWAEVVVFLVCCFYSFFLMFKELGKCVK